MDSPLRTHGEQVSEDWRFSHRQHPYPLCLRQREKGFTRLDRPRLLSGTYVRIVNRTISRLMKAGQTVGTGKKPKKKTKT